MLDDTHLQYLLVQLLLSSVGIPALFLYVLVSNKDRLHLATTSVALLMHRIFK